ncbi:TlpA family protein disulfide reductase [Mucilaginibacter polytrichastri]|uniref:Thioredoxin domain-containing protein n=1 Tax=Mucilaginibacter polytrichastri TaxID=1302689 RepID=A0A1Q5ZRX9_9SPHI|nr:TlpA disulfide reductase family protein [Mucilaginibacter polytrichastri]OKS84530.1 hypothetical protein RG47T_5220 [Mucilaginibacter polytrichastri]SFT23765.1 AhpC/TSA family protein [Mucilaginibacter polytrichastri]
MFKYILASLMLLFTCAKAQVISNRTSVVPQKPIPGKPLELLYNARLSPLDKAKQVKAAFYQFSDYKWYTDTAFMEAQDSNLKATFNLLPGASFAAVKFYQGNLRAPDSSDNNSEKGFVVRITSSKGKRLPGAALAEAVFKLPGYSGGIPGYFAGNSAKLSADSLALLLNEELKQKDSKPSRFVHYYLALQRAIKGLQFKSDAPAILNMLLEDKDLTEDDLVEIQRVKQFDLKDEAGAAKLRTDILAKYPNGKFARLEAFQGIIKDAKSNEQIIANGEAFLKKFPIAEWRKHPDNQDYIYYGAYRNLAIAYFDSGNFDALIRLRPDWDFKTEDEIYRWNVGRAYMHKTVEFKKLQPLADSLYKDLLTKINDGSYSTDFDSKVQAQDNAYEQLKNRTEDQINIHYLAGDYKGSLAYFEMLRPQDKFANADLNAIHVDMLAKTDQKQLIQPLLENSVRANAVTPAMFNRLKEVYEQHGNTEGYDNYLASLKSADKMSQLQATVKAHMLNKDIMPFAMEDSNGNIVRSTDWGDKIVVIDFWATWCRPCIAAFPGMQMLVDKYAKDPKVDFYFVGTMQFGDYKQKVKDFMKREGWRFKVLHDGINKKTGEEDEVFSTFAKMFNSSGIPRKVILKDGIMRYTTEGYGGSPSELEDEISYAVEMLKAEK